MSLLVDYWRSMFTVPSVLSSAIMVLILFSLACLLFSKRPLEVLRRPTGVAIAVSAWWYMTCMSSDIVFSQGHPEEPFWARLLRLTMTVIPGIVLIWLVAGFFRRRGDDNGQTT